jgi:hypothetical protein
MNKINVQLILALLSGSLVLASCGNETKSGSDSHQSSEGMRHDSSSNAPNAIAESGNVTSDYLSVVLLDYFEMNENLVQDNASGAATASSKLVTSLKGFKGSNLSVDEQKEVNDILENATEHAEHISDNASDISHQRDHLISLSTDINDLIAIVGTSQKLYEDFCPMADNGKGAIWISDKEAISNPYMGTKMPTCGNVKRVIN